MSATADHIQRVHKALFPTHGPTPLHSVPALACELGCKAVYVKDESSRFGLPAFKILGASWAVASFLGDRWGVEPWDVTALREKAKDEPDLTIYTATDGALEC
jgi:diaminopropionate ammonia-lyase